VVNLARTIKKKELFHTKLANNYGGWIYCDNCEQTIGYLCYVTYHRVNFNYTCNCGNEGSVAIELNDSTVKETSSKKLNIIKNRLCCPEDNSPLITIQTKKLKKYSCQVVCSTCQKEYTEEGKEE
jgi:hypothetical protein